MEIAKNMISSTELTNPLISSTQHLPASSTVKTQAVCQICLGKALSLGFCIILKQRMLHAFVPWGARRRVAKKTIHLETHLWIGVGLYKLLAGPLGLQRMTAV